MTIAQIIKSFEKLSPNEQDDLLEILRQHRAKTREAEILANARELKNKITSGTAKVGTVDDLKADLDTEKKDFWSALQEFRSRVDLESLDDDTFDNLRDKSPGRDVIL